MVTDFEEGMFCIYASLYILWWDTVSGVLPIQSTVLGECIKSISFMQKNEHIPWLQILRKEYVANMPICCISYDGIHFSELREVER